MALLLPIQSQTTYATYGSRWRAPYVGFQVVIADRYHWDKPILTAWSRTNFSSDMLNDRSFTFETMAARLAELEALCLRLTTISDVKAGLSQTKTRCPTEADREALVVRVTDADGHRVGSP